jgi:glycosyltransferase involved in cell wall biosynthesis
MNILFPYMARWSSAHASRYYHLLTKVAQRGHHITVIQPPSRFSGELNDVDVSLPTHENIKVITVPFPRWFWNTKFPADKLVKKLVFTLTSVPLVKKTLRKEKIDLLYLYNLPQSIYLLGKKPFVVFDYADDLLGMLAAELSITHKHILYRCARACLRWMIRNSDIVLCISETLLNSVQHERKYLLPNGAHLPENSAARDQQNNRHKITVGYVGTFEYTRAIRTVLEAAKRLPDVHFLLVGSGRDLPSIQNDVAREKLTNITLTGAVSHQEAQEYIRSMDICLNLYNKIEVTHAISPLKLFEYLSHKKPVISTRLREVERINKGFLFFADTAEEIVERIQYIVSHRAEAQHRAEEGFAEFQKNYTWSKLADDFLHVLDTMMPKQR